MKCYRYLFYKLYQWFNKKSDIAEYKAIFGISILILVNIITLPAWYEIITGVKVNIPKIPKAYIGIMMIVFIMLHYYALVYKEKYKNIVKEFEHENEQKRKKGNVIIISYVIGSYVFLFLSYYIAFFLRR